MRERCRDPEAEADDHRHAERARRERGRRRGSLENAVQHRTVAVQPDAEVSVRKVGHVGRVLLPERPVQPQLVPELRRALLGQGLIAGKDQDRISRDQMQH